MSPEPGVPPSTSLDSTPGGPKNGTGQAVADTGQPAKRGTLLSGSQRPVMISCFDRAILGHELAHSLTDHDLRQTPRDRWELPAEMVERTLPSTAPAVPPRASPLGPRRAPPSPSRRPAGTPPRRGQARQSIAPRGSVRLGPHRPWARRRSRISARSVSVADGLGGAAGAAGLAVRRMYGTTMKA